MNLRIKTITALAIACITTHVSFANYEWQTIKLDNWKKISAQTLYETIEKSVNKKKNLYEKLKYSAKLQLTLQKANNEKINEITKNLVDKLKEEISLEENKVQEKVIWYSTSWKEIKITFKWNVNKEFTLFTADIHWWYEYWTYLSALRLKEALIKSWKKQWMIIDTLNPDWLQKYFDRWTTSEWYIDWRWNSNSVDLNRNFCTNNFKTWSYTKKALTKEKTTQKLSLWEKCWTEKEIQAFDNLLYSYNFSRVIDIHSKWWVIFIPDWTIENKEITELWMKTKELLWQDYMFDVSFLNEKEKKKKINFYEVDSWWYWVYTWMLITYTYEKFWIPSIIIELKEHWIAENKITKLTWLVD